MENLNVSADFWTKYSFASEIVTSYVSDAYWVGNVVDLGISFFANTEPAALGLTGYGLGIGLGIATVSAIGSSYCHYHLNLKHQEILANQSNGTATHVIQSEITPLINNNSASLKWYQKFALAGDFLSHVGEYAGPITFVIELATQNKIPPYGKLLTQCGATLFGISSSMADVRTCKNNLQEMNTNTVRQTTLRNV